MIAILAGHALPMHAAHHHGLTLTQVCMLSLLAGLVLTAIFAIFGTISGATGHGIGHLQTGPARAQWHGGEAATDAGLLPAEAPHWGTAPAPARRRPAWQRAAGRVLPWLSPLSLSAWLAWFGGGGLIAALVAPPVALPAACLSGVLGAGLVRSMMTMLARAATQPLQGSAEGAIGTLNSPIRPDAAGEVIYTIEGLHRSAPARCMDGRPLPRGARVVIVRRERGIAWVLPLDPLAPE
jgi:hypothetical protein